MLVERVTPGDAPSRRVDVAIVVDVLRATTTAVCLLSAGAPYVRVVATPDDLRRSPPGPGERRLVVSELDAARALGEWIDNSPVLARSRAADGSIPWLVTTNGTRAVFAARSQADAVLLGSLSNLGATVDFVRAMRPSRVALVPAGSFEARTTRAEDEACADLIAARLAGRFLDETAAVAAVRADERIARRIARDPEYAADVDFALRIDTIPMVVEVAALGDGGLGCYRPGQMVPPV